MANDSININSIRINVLYDGEEVLTKDFAKTSEPITIGREQDVEIPLEDTFVSKKHCAISFKGSSVILEDLGSRNGTLVNGRKATSLELINGDKIQLGKTTIIVIIPEKDGEIFESKTKELSFSDTGELSIEELEIKKAHREEVTRERQKEAHDKAKKKNAVQKIVSKTHDTSPVILSDEYYYEEEDDDDDEEAFHYYPLLPKIIGSEAQKSQASIRGSSDERVEIIQSPGDDIQEIESIKKGESFRIILDEKNYRFLKYSGRGECQIFFKENFKGHIYAEGKKIPLSKLMTSEASVRGNRFKSIFKSGDLAEIDTGSHKYYLRFAQSVELPVKIRSKTERSFLLKVLGSSVALHLAIMIILSIYATFVKASEDNARAEDLEDRFVKLDLKDLEPKPPEPTPAPTVVSTPAPKPIAQREANVKKPKITVKTMEKKSTQIIGVKKARRVGGGGSGNVNVAAVGVLASLGGLTTDSTSSTNVIRAVSNLDAVKAPRGTQSTFSVSGLIGKSVSGDAKIVRISGPATKGVGGIDKQFGAIGTLGGRKGRGVGGIVVGDVPTFEIGVKGSLSRQQILEVVQKHAGELSYCYEKALGDDPNLEGKLLMFWEINAGGGVGDVRIKSASLRSTSVNRCVMTNIKTWQFPKPKGGGMVQVTFPFVFNAASF